MHAHMINIVEPRTFDTELKIIMELNNLPTKNAPKNPPSGKIFTKTSTAEQEAQIEET